MKLQLMRHSPRAVALAWGTIFAASLLSVNAQADEWNKKTVLTVNQPIQIRETYLEPGQYVLKLLNSSSDRHVVQIFNGDESHIINTVLAVPTERVNPTGHTQFSFWETPAGTAKALRAWYYPGDNVGNEFPYPKQPRQLMALLTPPAPLASSFSDESTITATTTANPDQPVVMDDTTSVQTDQTAQDETPPAPAVDETPVANPSADTSTDSSADTSAPTELPKTGSPYPLIGLCGLGLAGLAGALALKRTA